jgi:hypothetical protein
LAGQQPLTAQNSKCVLSNGETSAKRSGQRHRTKQQNKILSFFSPKTITNPKDKKKKKKKKVTAFNTISYTVRIKQLLSDV